MRVTSALLVTATTLASACGGARPLEGNGGAGSGVVTVDASRQAPYGYFYANSVDGGKIFAVQAGGGSPELLAAGANGDNLGDAFAFDDANVYYSVERSSADMGLSGAVLALSPSGGAPRTLVDGLDSVKHIAVDAQNVYFASMAVTDGPGTPFIGSVAKAGGAVQRLVELSSADGVSDLAVANDFLYWTQPDGRVRRVPAAGGAAETLVSGEASPLAIAADATGVYWLALGQTGVDCTARDGALRHLASGAGAPTTLASGLAGARSLALGDGAVFWSTAGFFCNVGGEGLGSVFELTAANPSPRALATGVTGPSDLFVAPSIVYFTTIVDENTYTLAPVAKKP
jgi:hypothetical protein